MTSGLAALWVWRLAGHSDADAMIRAAASADIAELAISVPWSGPDEVITHAVRAGRDAGLRVSCLGSDPRWVHRPADAVDWARRAVDSAPFDGLHLDVEPWQLREWDVDRVATIRGYIVMLATVRAAFTHARIVADVAPTLAHEEYDGRNALERALGSVDGVWIMAYRDRVRGPDGILEFSAAAREICARTSSPYLLGVETQPPSARVEPRHTFGDDGRAALAREVMLLHSDLTADSRFGGTAVHDWRHWAALRP